MGGKEILAVLWGGDNGGWNSRVVLSKSQLGALLIWSTGLQG